MDRKLPVMLRSTHEFFMDSMRINLQSREELIKVLREQLAEKNKHIDALQEMLTSPKCNDYTQQERKPEQVLTTGRGGWRARAEEASNKTIPVPKDSVKALEQRVTEQGGKVDAVQQGKV
jgi:hypothetical protein